MPSLKDRFGALSLGNVQITCPELGRSVHAYQWLLERKPRFNACIKKKRESTSHVSEVQKKWMCYENLQVRLFKNLWSVCLSRYILNGECHMRMRASYGSFHLRLYTVYLSLWFNATTRRRPLRKLPKSQFEPSEIAKCLPSGIIEFGV